ncbi:hypothetical protein K8I28_10635 [bacterium]|nr:hypothetical protein [bacterium]
MKRFTFIWLFWIFILFTSIVPVKNLYATAFMVRPSRLVLVGTPGELISTTVGISNNDSQAARAKIQIAVLDQSTDGKSRVVPSEELDELAGKLRSCAEFITLENESIVIPGLQTFNLSLEIQLPNNARGTYYCAMIVASDPDRDQPGLAVVVNFLVPITVEVEGVAQRKDISISNIEMFHRNEFTDNRSGKLIPASDWISLSLENAGIISAEVKGDVTIMRQSGKRWKRVTEVSSETVNMLPKTSWPFLIKIPKALPSGNYQVRGTLHVDGRRMRPLEKIIDYRGDPNITELVEDVVLMIQPAVLEVEGVQGAKRNVRLNIQNPSDQNISFVIDKKIPTVLQSVAIGDLLGKSFASTQWLEIKPDKFHLRGGAERSLLIHCVFPEDSLEHPFYYSTIGIHGYSQNGDVLTNEEVVLIAKNISTEGSPKLQANGMTISIVENDIYSITARFGNVGNTHLLPELSAFLGDVGDTKMLQRINMTEAKNMIIPMEIPTYSGEVDLSRIDDGYYRIHINAKYSGGVAKNELTISVVNSEAGKSVKVMDN